MKTPPRLLAILLACNLTGCADRSGLASADQPRDLAAIEAKVAALRQVVEAAEAVRDVKRLQWAYGHYSEFGLWHDFADLFADTGVGHYVQGDLNRAGIRDLFFKQVGQGRLGLAEGRIYPHISFSPVVTLEPDGRHAKGRFRILAMLGGYGGNAIWFHGLYENAYVREGGVWKVNELSNTAQISGSFSAALKPADRAKAGTPYLAFHYDPAQVGRMTVPAGRNAGSVPGEAKGARDFASLAAEVAELRRRARRLAGEAAITHLQNQYADALDAHDVDRLAGLFAEDATYENGQQGVYIGRNSIRRALAVLGAPPRQTGAVDDHLLFQTYVSLSPEGDRAFARLDQLGMQGSPGGSAEWTQGIYENSFVKQDGQWRIQALQYYPRLITDYHKGWGKNAQAAPAASTNVPPDAPPTEIYGSYPAFHIPAFHFLHPVTGAKPQYPDGDPAALRAMGFGRAGAAADTVAPAGDAQELLRQVGQVQAQVARTQSIDAVENLLQAYAYYLDECMVEQAAQLFSDGAVRGNALALLRSICPAEHRAGELTLHHTLQPVTTLSQDGARATIVARLWEVHATTADGGNANRYSSGTIAGEAVLQGDRWFLTKLAVHKGWTAREKEGFARAQRN